LKILAIDTSERIFSVAALSAETVLAEIMSGKRDGSYELEYHKGLGPTGHHPELERTASHAGVAVGLFSTIQRVLEQAKWKVGDVELVAVAEGPGSFTGLRTGIVAAKTIAYVQKIPVQAVNTLESVAMQLCWYIESAKTGLKTGLAPGSNPISVHCLINAQRQQLFAASYLAETSEAGIVSMVEQNPAMILDRDSLLQRLRPNDWLIGTGLSPLLSRLPEKGVQVAPQCLWWCRAATIGKLAWRDYQAGRRDDLWTLEPVYFRPSYADDK
jgi:tRNA threonylcarbamoyladenosine biosynthesis protein TsaB